MSHKLTPDEARELLARYTSPRPQPQPQPGTAVPPRLWPVLQALRRSIIAELESEAAGQTEAEPYSDERPCN
jgi:hypothetical protein